MTTHSSNAPSLSLAVLAVLKLFPSSVGEALLSDDTFKRRYRLKSDALISFDNCGVSIQRSTLFNGIREILANSDAQPVLMDKAGDEWLLEIEEDTNGQRILLSQKERRLFLPDLSTLSPDQAERMTGFNRVIVEVNLPEDEASKWREILVSRALTDDEQIMLDTAIKEMPVRVSALVASELDEGTFSLSSCVPRSGRYFERLVGEYQEGHNLEEYAHVVAREHIQKLMSWHPYEGFLFALLLSAHSLNVAAIDVEQLEEGDLIKAYEWLQKNGDLFSQLGAIEIGLSILDRHPDIEPYIKDMIEQVRSDSPDDKQGRFELLSSLIILIEGELSRTRVLRRKPPFWRRLASIAQACLIERCTNEIHGDVAKFTEWAMGTRAQPFYIQNMTDLRIGPRWIPDYVSSRQLKAEFICRIINSADRNISKIESPDIRKLLFGEGHKSLRALIEFPYSYLPGPLEGGVDSEHRVPDELVQSIKEQLGEIVLQPGSFTILMNSALIYRLDSDQAQLAANALRAAKHQLRKVDNKELLFSILKGLATVAAVTRSKELAGELIILDRRSRGCESGNKLSAEESLWIGLTAAAAHLDLAGWCKFVGEWITELAFQPLGCDEMDRLHSHVEQLCHIVPELWHTCGRAEAALNSY